MQSVFPKGRTRAREATWPYRQILVVWIPLYFPLIWHWCVFEAHMDLFQHILVSHTSEGRKVVHFLLHFRSMQYILPPSSPPSLYLAPFWVLAHTRLGHLYACLTSGQHPLQLGLLFTNIPRADGICLLPAPQSFPFVPRRLFFPAQQQEKQLDDPSIWIWVTKGLELRAQE